MIACRDCAALTSGRCSQHATRFFTTGADGQLVECDPIAVRPPMTGWMCPGCGSCYSPLTDRCDFCGPKTTIFVLPKGLDQ